MIRERFEEELRTLVRARSIALRAEPEPPGPGVMCFEVPVGGGHHRGRIEAVFEAGRRLDGWTCQVLESATHVAGLILEIERATGRLGASARGRADGAAPLIGSSAAIRAVRDRIERVAATDFTVLIEGAMGPQPHPSFIEVCCQAPFGDLGGGGGSGGGWRGSDRKRFVAPQVRPGTAWEGRLFQTELHFYRHHDGGRKFGDRPWLKPPLPDRIQRFLIQPKIRPRSVENTGRSNRAVLQNDNFEKRKPLLLRPNCAPRIVRLNLVRQLRHFDIVITGTNAIATERCSGRGLLDSDLVWSFDTDDMTTLMSLYDPSRTDCP